MDRHEEQTWLQRVTGAMPGLSLSERQLRNRRRGRFIFTDKKHPWRGIFSVLISLISFTALIAAVVLTVRRGESPAAFYWLLFSPLPAW